MQESYKILDPKKLTATAELLSRHNEHSLERALEDYGITVVRKTGVTDSRLLALQELGITNTDITFHTIQHYPKTSTANPGYLALYVTEHKDPLLYGAVNPAGHIVSLWDDQIVVHPVDFIPTLGAAYVTFYEIDPLVVEMKSNIAKSIGSDPRSPNYVDPNLL